MSKNKFLKCQACGNVEFEEVALLWTRQAGVRIGKNGLRDYEKAGTVELEDSPPVGTIYYKCTECDGEFVVKNKRLVRTENTGDSRR